MSFTITSHDKSNRVQVVKIKSEDLEKLIFPFQKHTITSLEYKPFSRFTLAKSNIAIPGLDFRNYVTTDSSKNRHTLLSKIYETLS